MRTRTSGRLGLLGVVAIVFPACANVLGFDDISFDDEPAGYTGPATSVACGTVPASSLACAACINASCCAAAQTCGAGGACVQLAKCRLGCALDDVTCLHDCGIDYFDGIRVWQELDACEVQSCVQECGG
jgi:hypothetical protein